MADTRNSNVQTTRFTVLSVLLWLSASAMAQEGASLIGHWTLDNGANDAVGTYNGQLIGIGADNPALPAAVPGKIGQALEFDGATSVEIPIDLDYRTHSALTVTMWVRLGDKPRVGASQVLISTGAGDGPRIELARNQVRASAAGRILGPKHTLLPGKWNFVAVTWDHAAGNMSMTVNNTQAFYPLGYEAKRSQQVYISPRDPDLEKYGRKGAQKRYLWIGAKDGFGPRASLKDVAVDDVRIYQGVVAADQLIELSGGVSNGTYIPEAYRGWGGPWRSPISGDELNPNLGLWIPGDQYEPAQLPGDQYDPRALPGDQYDPAQLPGDQYDARALPGDQYDPAQLPGDQYDPRALPGDQYEPTQIPSDQAVVVNHEEQYSSPDIGDGTDAVALQPGQDLNDLFVSPTGDQVAAGESGQRVMSGQTDSLPGSGNLDGSSDAPTSLMPGGSRDLESDTAETLQDGREQTAALDITDTSAMQESSPVVSSALPGGRTMSRGTSGDLQDARDENAPLDITYGSEEEGMAAAAHAEAQRQATAPRYSPVLGETSHYRDELDLVTEFVKTIGVPNTYEGCAIRLNGREFKYCDVGRPGNGNVSLTSAKIDRIGAHMYSGAVDYNPAFTCFYVSGITETWEGKRWFQEDQYVTRGCSDPSGRDGKWLELPWGTTSCPTGTWATGFVVHTSEIGLDGAYGRRMKGIELICREQVWQEMEDGQ